MKIVFAIAPNQFLDQEYTVPISILREKGVECITASTIEGVCYGMRGEIVKSDISFDSLNVSDYDGIIIVGGIGCQDYLWRCQKLIDVTSEFGKLGKLVAGICLAPVVIAESGLLVNKKATVFESPASRRVLDLDKAVIVDDSVVVSGSVITAKMPKDVYAFTEAILRHLSL